MSSFLNLFDNKPKISKTTSSVQLRETPKNSVSPLFTKSKSQTNVVNGIYRTVRPVRSRTGQDDRNGAKPNLMAYKSNDNKMFVSPTTSRQSELNSFSNEGNEINNISSVDDLITNIHHSNSDVVYYRRFSSSEDEIELKNQSQNNPYVDEFDDDLEENNDEVLVDILPSFQFYDSLVKFLPQDTVDDDVPRLTNNNNSQTLLEREIDDDGDGMNPPEYYPNPSMQSTAAQQRSQSGANNGLASAFRYEVDKLYKLPHKITNNIEIKIVLTKTPVEPNTISEKENLLREFSSGEMINGYVTILNKSTRPIKFEGFYVSLEGLINLSNIKGKNTTTMRFLKTHDLSASWSYAQVELASGVNYDATVIDETDNSRLGLPNSKVLKPKLKYKKYFCFKLPKEMLDSNCKHQIPHHLALPPSFGLDRAKPENRFIEMNNVLGYGHTGLKGSAILCPDLASYDDFVAPCLKKNIKGNKLNNKLKHGFLNEGSNINYTISCKLIMKNETTNTPYVLNDTVHSVRIIPNTLSTNSKYRYLNGKSSLVNHEKVKQSLFDLNARAIKRVDQLETLLQKLEHWKDDTIFNKEDLTSHLSDIFEKKQDQEQSKNHGDYLTATNKLLKKQSFANTVIPTYSNLAEQEIFSTLPQLPDTFSESFTFHSDFKKGPISSFEKINSFFGNGNQNSSSSFSSLESASNAKSDMKVLVETKLDKDFKALPYHRSKYITCHNKIENKNKADKKVWVNEVISQLPLAPIDYELTSLPLKITAQNHHGLPPKLKAVKTTLHAYTAYTQRSCPILLDSSLCLQQRKILDQIVFNSKESSKKIQTLKQKFTQYEERLKRLIEKFQLDERFLKFETFIDPLLISDLEALATLKIEEFEMANVFKDTVIPPEHLLKWVSISDDKIQCELDVNLNYRDDLMLAILPTFDTCLISRFYHLQVECEFSNSQTATLKVPVDVKHFK